jgi:DNA-directed RNA polymerase specialized sigma24 family protein
VSPTRDDELDAGSVGRRERLRTAYAAHRLDLLRLADLLGADEPAADDAVEAAYLALARRPWVRDPAAFLEREVVRRCPAAERAAVLRFRAGDRSLDPAVARGFAARGMSVLAGPPRLEASLRRRATRRRRVAAAALVLAVVAAGAVFGVRAAVRSPPPAPAGPAPLAPAVDVPAPAVGTVPLGRYGLAVLADPGVEVLDATDGRTALLAPAAKGATALGTSHDGRYVAARVSPHTLEVLDQQDDLVWTGSGDVAAWSPTADTLALDGPAGFELLTPHRLGYGTSDFGGNPTGTPAGIAWRPDGKAVAIGTDTGLTVFGVGVPFFASPVTAPAATVLDPVTWTADGTHLLVFDEPDGTELNTYGVRVLDASLTGERLSLGRQLGATEPQPGWWSADGRGAVLGVLGTGHGAVEGQRVVRCDLTAGTCASLAAGVDPVATASGIAYLVGGGMVTLAGVDGSHAAPAVGAPLSEQVLADGDVLLLAAPTGIYRYAGGTARLLTRTDTDGAAGQGTEIVSWQPNARSTQ